ncbi:MAG: D-alanyl-D-alanine carboxypeptidase family protein [Bacillota bacterium]|nr:D-alanyl-D-alanine carboxypeptidase family protein [Bacillota bacterium]
MKRFFYYMAALLTLLLLAPPAAQAAADTSSHLQMLINQQYRLSADYQPEELVSLSNYMPANSGVTLNRIAAEAWRELYTAMKAAGISDCRGVSGYRTYDTQVYLYNRKVNQYQAMGYDAVDAAAQAATVVAIPGASEHQSGMALDLSTSTAGLTEAFAYTAAGKWLKENSWRYGLILRYTSDKSAITGIISEPWHFRYVGKPHAEYMYKNGLCLEEYIQRLQQLGSISFIGEDGEPYCIYYSSYYNAAELPGQILGYSQAMATAGGFIISTLAPREPLFDMSGHWAESDVRAMYEAGLISGYPSGAFLPDRNISRAELLTLLARFYEQQQAPSAPTEAETEQAAPDGEPDEAADGSQSEASALPFADVDSGDYFYAALLTCQEAGLLGEHFYHRDETQPELILLRPQAAATRRDTALALAALLADLQPPDAPRQFADQPTMDAELLAAAQLLSEYAIMNGRPDGSFDGAANITRAEICACINRISKLFATATAAANGGA